MAKKKRITEQLPEKPKYDLKSPLETNHSKGYFWIRDRNSYWVLYYECWKNGVKQKAEKISQADYKYCHLRPEMTFEQAQAQIKAFNKDRKKNLSFTGSQVRAAKRQREMLEADKDLFPSSVGYTSTSYKKLKVNELSALLFRTILIVLTESFRYKP